ncbi:hypothetical protein [Actinoplanes solisilvae]|uniref:hypothetical protein n=1 Tax=Actinoplanes solisilvae TaxID=2486853 RepID=UPI000FDCB4E9|nr:hypothetical protein [Actinoplanes solisilvae]
MGTDIYGVIEVCDPARVAAFDYVDGLWVRCMDLYPLYPGSDYSAFGCLFGIRNWNRWEPVAEGRGLPSDVSQVVRTEYEEDARLDGAIHGSTWVSWSELRDLDMKAGPDARGTLTINEESSALWRYYRIDDHWPDEVREEFGPMERPPAETPYGGWQRGKTTFGYTATTRLDVLGPGTGWEHVFAVLRALGQRFGDDGVRLVVWFD